MAKLLFFAPSDRPCGILTAFLVSIIKTESRANIGIHLASSCLGQEMFSSKVFLWNFCIAFPELIVQQTKR